LALLGTGLNTLVDVNKVAIVILLNSLNYLRTIDIGHRRCGVFWFEESGETGCGKLGIVDGLGQEIAEEKNVVLLKDGENIGKEESHRGELQK